MKIKKTVLVFLLLGMVLTIAILSACSSGGGESAAVKDGIIELQDTKLDFGDNAVTDSSKATLTAMKLGDEDKPEGLASTLFELELDMSCTSPVTISIPLGESEKPEDEEAVPMLGLGNDLTISDGSVKTLYAYIPAQMKDGLVTATFTPAEYMEELNINGATGSAKPSKERLRLGIFWCSTTFTDGGHFIVNFPAQSGTLFINYSDRSALLSDLEEVYNDYLDKGYTYAKRSNWPVEVNVQSLSDMGYYSYGWSGAEGKIYINRSLFQSGYQASAVKPLLAHEFFHFVQLNYVDPGNDNTWFDEATATYFEGEKSGSIPSIVAEYNEKIFSGVLPEENDSANGYARMPLIKFLSNKLGESFILSAYTAAGGGSDWNSALVSSTGPVAGWASDFYEALVKGDVGSYAPYTLHTNLAAGERAEIGTALELKVPTADELLTIVENDEIPNLGETTLSVGPCGAQLVALTIDDTNLFRVSEGTDPVVSVAGGADVRVFAIRGSKVTVMQSSGGSVKLSNFKKSCEDKYVFLALVTGLHVSGNQSYALKVELPPYPTLDELVGEYPDGALTFTDIYISPDFRAAAANNEEEGEEDEVGCDISMIAMLDALKGQTQNNTLVIAKTGEDTGNLVLVDDEGEPSNPLPFTYLNGLLTFDYSEEGAILSGDLVAAYGKNKDVTIDGDLIVSQGEDLRIDLHISGSKPLPVA